MKEPEKRKLSDFLPSKKEPEKKPLLSNNDVEHLFDIYGYVTSIEIIKDNVLDIKDGE